MIEVQVNEQYQSCAEGTTVAALLEQLGYRCERVAVAVDNEFLPRTDYARRALRGGESLDVVAPVQGG